MMNDLTLVGNIGDCGTIRFYKIKIKDPENFRVKEKVKHVKIK